MTRSVIAATFARLRWTLLDLQANDNQLRRCRRAPRRRFLGAGDDLIFKQRSILMIKVCGQRTMNLPVSIEGKVMGRLIYGQYEHGFRFVEQSRANRNWSTVTFLSWSFSQLPNDLCGREVENQSKNEMERGGAKGGSSAGEIGRAAGT